MKHTQSLTFNPTTPEQPTMAEEPQTDLSETNTFNPNIDICTQLMQRYSSSSAPQHRHLLAAAAAIKSLLLEDSLPLSPLSYFTSAIDALSQHQNDVASASAVATLLSLVLSLVPDSAISPRNAAEGAAILVRVLQREMFVGSTSSAKCVVKCLGVLLGFCDLGDWDSVDLPFRTLLHWSTDKRPKVRKCALVYLENVLKCFRSRTVKKKSSNLILSQLENCMSVAVKLGVIKNKDGSGSEKCEAEQLDIVHALNVVRVALPFICDKTRTKIILKLIELLDSRSSTLTRPVLNAIEAFLEKAEDGIITQVGEDIIAALSLYVSLETNSKDSVICAANLLKISLDKLHERDIEKWNRHLSVGIKAIAGLLTREDNIASKSSNILKKLVVEKLPDTDSQPACDLDKNDEESKVVASMCSSIMELLDSFVGIPNEHTLSLLSFLFLKLGRSSSSYTRNIVLKLAEIFTHADGTKNDTLHLQKCFGCAIVAIGAENILSLVPISFDLENTTHANMWMVPILKKYTCGSSLGYFMEHIVPIAESLKKASQKVKKSVIGQDLQAHARDIWGLLPAFCRLPIDIPKNFHSFAKLMLVRLKKDASMYEDIADALQELVKQNKCLPKSDASIVEPVKLSLDISLEDYLLEKRNFFCYSKKAAIRNIKALSLHSYDVLLALMTAFLDSAPQKRLTLKKAISCLASISDSTVTKKIFISSLERFSLMKVAVSGDSDPSNSSHSDVPLDTSSVGDDPQWSLVLDLASSIVEGADEELVDLIFRSTKHALQAGDGKGVSEAYNTLSCILVEHPWFCSVKMDALVDLIIGLKSPADICSFSNRLSCLQLLLAHALKSSQDAENTKPFLILNDLILALKDPREEARKTAYDMLLRISSCVADSSAMNPEGPFNRLISMILGYLSGPSPHVTSAAVSALSVLVFKEPELCIRVPHVVSAVTSLLQTKAVETIKAVLGFIKVLVSCLEAKDLQDFIPAIVEGVLPWSSISRHHFRSKVTVIMEILIRKCGFPTIKLLTPERYQSFIRKVSQSRHGKAAYKEADSPDVEPHLSSVPTNGFDFSTRSNKRSHDETNGKRSGSVFQRNKRKKMQDFQSPTPGGTRSNVGGFDKKTNRFQHKSKFGQNQRSQKFDRKSDSSTRSNHGGIDKKPKRFQHYKPKSGQNQRSKNFDRAPDSKRMRFGAKNGQKGQTR